MTILICLVVLMGWSLLHSGPGLFDTVIRWFFFGFFVPVFIMVVLADSGVFFEGEKSIEDRKYEFIDDRCLHDDDYVDQETYVRRAEDAGRYFDANPDEFEE